MGPVLGPMPIIVSHRWMLGASLDVLLLFFQAEDGIRYIGVTGSSDVCSSDLSSPEGPSRPPRLARSARALQEGRPGAPPSRPAGTLRARHRPRPQTPRGGAGETLPPPWAL